MKRIRIVTLLLLLLFSMNINIDAADTKITCISSVFVFEDSNYKEVSDTDLLNLNDGEKVKLQFTLSSDNEVNAELAIDELSGFKQTGTIKVDGKEVEDKESIRIKITSDKVVVDVEGTIDYNKGKFKSSIRLTTNENNKEQVQTFGFKYYIEGEETKQQQFTVNFYGASGELVSSINAKKNEYITAPDYEIIGYNVIGFNERKDGSGTYFVSNKVTEDTNYYAVYQPKTFTVEYYVEDKLYTTKKVEYNNAAYFIDAPEIEGKEFVEWIGLLDNVNNNIKVYAVYKDTITNIVYINSPSFLSELIEETIEEDIHLDVDYEEIKSVIKQQDPIDNDEYFVELEEDGKLSYLNEDTIYLQLDEKDTSIWKYILIISLFLEALVLIYLFYQKKIKNNSNDSI
ncbi:hypothetical protein [Breznakia pachnodae]|uniref:Uncharacterized protein n=1 Tax=Breznakia pachnodae TaxID=265178 RepID=A0ABU0E1K1_9FIRM|nr:hypothetical protein [Breznakia pachnodae]MDQ0360766.1 hypothetical protein [Breznakia pachnodae]